jgi:hypothetical protein
MNADALLELIDRHFAHVRDGLRPADLERLSTAVGELSRAGDDEIAGRRALFRVKRALLPLPLDSPVRSALDALRLDPGDPVRSRPDGPRASALLARLAAARDDPAAEAASGEILAAARRRLLAAPSRSADGLDPATAADPLGAGLIRLPDPERGPRYPEFQFDPGGGRPRAIVRHVNRLLLAEEDPWGAADWWLGGNTWLAAAPAELLGRVPDELLAAAALALVEGDD